MSVQERVRGWVEEHTAVALVIGVALAGIAAVVMIGGGGVGNFFATQAQAKADLGRTAKFQTAAVEGDGGEGGAGGGAFVEVQEAEFDIDTGNVAAAADAIRGTATELGGYVEESRQSDSDLYRRVHLTVRVPDEHFEQFNDDLRQQYEVESYTVRNHRVSIQRQLDELTVINRSLRQYEEMREEVRQMKVGEERVDLLIQITEKELELTQRQKQYLRDLSTARQRSKLATVTITLEERKDVDLTPDNVGNRFKNAVEDMLDSITDIAIDTVTEGVTLFFRVLQLIVYAIIVLVPAGFAYRLGKKLYRRYWQ